MKMRKLPAIVGGAGIAVLGCVLGLATLGAAPPARPMSQANATPTVLTGTIQSLQSGYFELAAAGRAPLWVRIFGARIEENGRLAPATVLHAGLRVQVQGRMVGAQFWATSIVLLTQPAQQGQRQSAATHAAPFYKAPEFHAAPPQTAKPAAQSQPAAGAYGARAYGTPMAHAAPFQHPGTNAKPAAEARRQMAPEKVAAMAPLRFVPLRLVPVHNMQAYRQQQTQVANRLAAYQQAWNLLRSRQPSSYVSRQPYHSPSSNWNLQATESATQGANAPVQPVMVAPVASLFASGDGYGNFMWNGAPPTDVANAAFFSDPPAGWSDSSTIPGLLGGQMQWSDSAVPTTSSSPLQSPAQGVIVANSTQLMLVVPCYFDSGSGTSYAPHAHFEVELQAQDPVTGQWNQVLTDTSLDMYDAGAAPAGPAPANTTVVSGVTSYPWEIPVTVKQVISTVRVAVYITLYGSQGTAMNTNGNRAQSNSVGSAQQVWSFPSAQSVSTSSPNGAVVSDATAGHEWYASPVFQIALLPTGLLSLNVMPYSIIYLPPGNESDEKLESVTGYSDTVGYSFSSQKSTQIANTQGQAFSLSGGLSFSGVSLSASTTLGSSQTVISGQTSSNGETETLGVSGAFKDGLELRPCGGTEPPPNDAQTLWDEPFWCDQMVFIMHPVFAEWQYANPDGTHFDAAQLIAYAPTAGSDSANFNSKVKGNYGMRYLYECAYGGPLHPLGGSFGPDGSTYPVVSGPGMTLADGTQLTAQQCADLVQLDPFLADRWQGANLGIGNFTGRFLLVDSIPQSGVSGPDGISYPISDETLKSRSQGSQSATGTMTGSGQATSTQTTYKASVSATALGVTGNVGASVTTSSSQSQTTTMAITYSSSQTQTATTGTDVSIEVRDSGVIPSGQLIYVYRDLQFGGLALQDTNETKTEAVKPLAGAWKKPPRR